MPAVVDPVGREGLSSTAPVVGSSLSSSSGAGERAVVEVEIRPVVGQVQAERIVQRAARLRGSTAG